MTALARTVGTIACASLIGAAAAQRLSGQLVGVDPSRCIHLYATVGDERPFVDSAAVSAEGRFVFARTVFPTGFYQLALSDSDRVDIILSQRESEVEFRFDGTPLQEHITVLVSEENLRLWEYKRLSRSIGQTLRALRERRAQADPRNVPELITIDSLEAAANARRMAALDRFIAQDPGCYFAKVITADQRLARAIPRGSMAIKESIDWSDPDLLHCAVYTNALSALLQSAAPATGDVLIQASDSLLTWSSRGEECWRYTRRFLLQLFVQYAADQVVQHLVDNYVLGPRTIYPPEPGLLQLVAEQLKVSVGSMAPDISLPLPGRADTLKLHQFLEGNAYVVLFFYSSTCDHCHEQMPLLAALHREMRPRGLEIIGVALDDNVEDFDENIRDKGLLFPCYTELKAWGSPAAKALAVRATPTLILLDHSGRIVAKPHDTIELRDLLLTLPF